MRANSYNTGIASEYLILSKLYRLDLEAYISMGNKKKVDIRVILENGSTISIDVKSVRGYSSLVVNNVENKPNHFIVFVIYNNRFDDLSTEPDIYIVPSSQLPELIELYGDEKRVMKGKIERFKDQWYQILDGYGDNGMHSLEELEELENAQTIRYWNQITEMRKNGVTDEIICTKLGITSINLKIIEEEYNVLFNR